MDVNDVNKKNSIINHDGSKKNHLNSVFQRLEVTLNDKKKYADRIQALLTAWEQIVHFVSKSSSESPQPEFEYLFLNTLRYVLQGDWQTSNAAIKTHLTVTLQRFIRELEISNNHHSVLEQCRILESVVKNPWEHPTLCKILNGQSVDIADCIKYFNFENGKVIVIRLEMLLQSKCEDIAVQLSKYSLQAYSKFKDDAEGSEKLDFSQDEVDYITDIYFSSLLKTKKKTELIAEIKSYQLAHGLRILQRYKRDGVGEKYNENCKGARVWKYGKKLIELMSNTLLANAVLHQNLVQSQNQLEDLIKEWASVHTSNLNDIIPPLALGMIRKFVLIASSSKCIYPFCSFLINNSSCKEHDMNEVARCLIRAINQNMNEVEQYRVNQERDRLKETYEQLSKGFLLVSELFSDYQHIYKECLLTSFSITPSRECLQKIEAFVNEVTNVVKLQNKPEQNEIPQIDAVEHLNTQTQTTSQPADSTKHRDTCELNEILESMGVEENQVNDIKKELDSNKLNLQQDYKEGSAPAYISEIENLPLDDSILVDLNSILRYQRYHTLNWDVEWDKLNANCEQYLEYFEKKGFDDVELKYLNLDYNQFKDQPVNYDDCCGIEKGYEHYVYSSSGGESETETSTTYRKSGLSSTETDDDAFQMKKKRKRSSNDLDVERKAKRQPARKRGRPLKEREFSISDDSIWEYVPKQESNANSLKALRQFRLKKPKIATISHFSVQELKQLNDILEDSCRGLDAVEIPPLSPSAEIYEVLLEESTCNELEVRTSRCDKLVNPEKQKVIVDGSESTVYDQNIIDNVANTKTYESSIDDIVNTSIYENTTENVNSSNYDTVIDNVVNSNYESAIDYVANVSGSSSIIKSVVKIRKTSSDRPAKTRKKCIIDKIDTSTYDSTIDSVVNSSREYDSKNDTSWENEQNWQFTEDQNKNYPNMWSSVDSILLQEPINNTQYNQEKMNNAGSVFPALPSSDSSLLFQRLHINNGNNVKNGNVLKTDKVKKLRAPKKPRISASNSALSSMNYSENSSYSNPYKSESQSAKNSGANGIARMGDLCVTLPNCLGNIENLLRLDSVNTNRLQESAKCSGNVINTEIASSFQNANMVTENYSNASDNVLSTISQMQDNAINYELNQAFLQELIKDCVQNNFQTASIPVSNSVSQTIAVNPSNTAKSSGNGSNFATSTNCLYNSTFTSTSEPQADSSKVNNILSHYRKAVDLHPELQNIPAARKRTTNNGDKPPRKPRPRKSQVKEKEIISKSQSYLGMTGETQSNQNGHRSVETMPRYMPGKNSYYVSNSSNIYNNYVSTTKSKLPSSYLNSVASSQMYDLIKPITSVASVAANKVSSSIGTQTINESADQGVRVPVQYSKSAVNGSASSSINRNSISNVCVSIPQLKSQAIGLYSGTNVAGYTMRTPSISGKDPCANVSSTSAYSSNNCSSSLSSIPKLTLNPNTSLLKETLEFGYNRTPSSGPVVIKRNNSTNTSGKKFVTISDNSKTKIPPMQANFNHNITQRNNQFSASMYKTPVTNISAPTVNHGNGLHSNVINSNTSNNDTSLNVTLPRVDSKANHYKVVSESPTIVTNNFVQKSTVTPNTKPYLFVSSDDSRKPIYCNITSTGDINDVINSGVPVHIKIPDNDYTDEIWNKIVLDLNLSQDNLQSSQADDITTNNMDQQFYMPSNSTSNRIQQFNT